MLPFWQKCIKTCSSADSADTNKPKCAVIITNYSQRFLMGIATFPTQVWSSYNLTVLSAAIIHVKKYHLAQNSPVGLIPVLNVDQLD